MHCRNYKKKLLVWPHCQNTKDMSLIIKLLYNIFKIAGVIRRVSLEKYMKKSNDQHVRNKLTVVPWWHTSIFNFKFDPLYQGRIYLHIYFKLLTDCILWSDLKKKLKNQENALAEKDLYLKEKNGIIDILEKQRDNMKSELEKVKNKNRGQYKVILCLNSD